MYFHSQFVNVTFPQPIRVTNEVWVTVRVHSLTKFLLAYFRRKVASPFCPPPKLRGRGTQLESERNKKQGNLGLNNVQIVAICCENLIEVSSKKKQVVTHLFALLLFPCLLFLAETHLTYIYWCLCQYLLNKWSREATFKAPAIWLLIATLQCVNEEEHPLLLADNW